VENTKSLPPRRVPNASVRSREHLTEAEVARLRASAGKVGRHGYRDSLMILMAYRHGFRASELVNLRCDQVDFEQRALHVTRKKRGTPSTHPLGREELAGLRRILGSRRTGPVFETERGGAMTTSAFGKIVARAGELAGLGMPAHPHMLRHGCGYYLANRGHDTRAIQAYLGHRNIQHTVRYTELAQDRFKDWWQD
jgi:integrase